MNTDRHDPTDEIRDQLEEQTALLDSIAANMSWVGLAAKLYVALLALGLVAIVVTTIVATRTI